jgi:hypothetical protein
MLNKTVFHKSFGKGTITSQETTADNKVYITVDFGDKKSTFPFPDTFKTFLTTEDEEFKVLVENALEEQHSKKEEQKKITTVQPIIKSSPSSSPKMVSSKAYEERTVYAQTNAEFLNSEFGTNYEQWYRSTWEYSCNTVVWMGVVNGAENNNWANHWLDKDHSVMIEEYTGIDRVAADKAIEYSYRIIAEKDFSYYSHKFYVRGLFKYDAKESSTYKHIWRKVN